MTESIKSGSISGEGFKRVSFVVLKWDEFSIVGDPFIIAFKPIYTFNNGSPRDFGTARFAICRNRFDVIGFIFSLDDVPPKSMRISLVSP